MVRMFGCIPLYYSRLEKNILNPGAMEFKKITIFPREFEA